jgi:MurNAc alpha-1-phosphate uridylyltransferase
MATAIILAAGRGERMRPLTDTLPKPLLRAGGLPLIEWQIRRLVKGGFTDLVVNHSHLGHLIERDVGNGSRFGVRIRYSHEPRALETAGGVERALPLLGDGAFAVVSGDIYTAYDYAALVPRIAQVDADARKTAAHFVLVDNPPYHPRGDMGLEEGRVTRAGPLLTYANISIYHPSLFDGLEHDVPLKLFPWAYRFVEEGRVTGEHYRGPWDNVGTPEQLAALDRALSEQANP